MFENQASKLHVLSWLYMFSYGYFTQESTNLPKILEAPQNSRHQ